MRKYIAFIAVAMFFASIDAEALQSVAWWEARFQGQMANQDAIDIPRSLNGDDYDIYDMAYGINGERLMFQATGNTLYLNRALTLIENIISTAAISSSLSLSQYQDSYLGWQTDGNNPDTTVGEFDLYESYCWRYVTATLMAMKQNEGVFANTAYRARYDAILAFTEANIWNKWYTRNTAHIYQDVTHLAAHWATIAAHLSLMTTNPTQQAIYDTVWRDIDYDGMANRSGASLRTQIITNPADSTAYWWNWNWGQFSTPGSDVSHGNAVAMHMIEIHDLGLYWTDADMTKMVNLVKLILNDATYPYYLNNTGSGDGWVNDGLAQLGRYDSVLQAKIETHTVGEGTTLYGAGAYNAKVLLSSQTTPLVGYWKLNETSGTTAADSAGTVTGTLTNGPTPGVDGKVDKAVLFDGTNDYINLGNAKFDLSTLTVCAWFKTSVALTSADARVVTSGSENTNLWILNIAGTGAGLGKLIMSGTSASHATVISNNRVDDQQWHHGCGSRSPEAIYVDGVLQSGTFTDSWSFEANSKIGSRGTSHYFPGIIDDVRVYSGDLTASEVRAIYNEVLPVELMPPRAMRTR